MNWVPSNCSSVCDIFQHKLSCLHLATIQIYTQYRIVKQRALKHLCNCFIKITFPALPPDDWPYIGG